MGGVRSWRMDGAPIRTDAAALKDLCRFAAKRTPLARISTLKENETCPQQ
jgi:hypothetical protein